MSRGRPASRAWFPAALSGLLVALAAPPSPLPLLVLVGLAPWAAAVSALPVGAAGRRRAARAGAVLFAVTWAVQLLWVARLALRVGWWPLPAYVAQVALLALLGAGVGALLHALVARVPLPVALALVWSAGEWVRGSALGPLDFPWMGVAVPLTAHPELIQAAAWIGERGLAAAVGLVNGAAALGLLRSSARRSVPAAQGAPGEPDPLAARGLLRPHVPFVLAATGVALAWTAGAVRLALLEPRPVLTALAVQPAVPLALKRTEGPFAVAATVAALDGLVPDTALAHAELVVLPETAVPVRLDGTGARPLRGTVAGWAARTGVPVVVGALGTAAGGRATNAVFLADADADALWPRADKARLVPGVEWSPLDEGSYAAGRRPALLDLAGGLRLGVLVCIESAGPEPARALRRAGADVLVNVTNDAWLGEAPPWTRTAAFVQHPAHLRLRAVETGAGALRVANNGRSTVVDPGGRERLLLPPHAAGKALARVTSLPSATPFTATGDLAGPGCLVLALLLLVHPARPRGAAPGTTEGPAGGSAAGGADVPPERPSSG